MNKTDMVFAVFALQGMQCVCTWWELEHEAGPGLEREGDEASARIAGLPQNTHTQASLPGSVYDLSIGIF